MTPCGTDRSQRPLAAPAAASSDVLDDARQVYLDNRAGVRRSMRWIVIPIVGAWGSARSGFLRVEEKPIAVVVVAAGATIATSLVLASFAGWPRVLRVMQTRHSWAWLAICLVGELVAYRGRPKVRRRCVRTSSVQDAVVTR